MEALKGDTYNEVVLLSPDGNLLEGLSSNFAVITNANVILTAPPTLVLPGTILKAVKHVVDSSHLTWKEECPDLAKRTEWKAAFITSTSRLLLPVDRIDLPDGYI